MAGKQQQLRRNLRFAGRLSAAAVALLVFTLVGVQFWKVIDENIAMASELRSVNADISSLRKRHDDNLRQLRRLQDPDGAIPEIHDRLRLVKPNEAMIFVSPAPASVQ